MKRAYDSKRIEQIIVEDGIWNRTAKFKPKENENNQAENINNGKYERMRRRIKYYQKVRNKSKFLKHDKKRVK